MESKPTVGVVMPTYRHWNHIEEALESYAAQTYTRRRLVVVIDGCERTRDLFKERDFSERFRCAVLPMSMNRGPASAISIGHDYLMADGPALCVPQYLTWISSDNVMHPEWLSRMVECLESDRDAMACYSPYIRETGSFENGRWHCRSSTVFRKRQVPDYWRDRNCNIGPAFLYRAELWGAVGPHRGVTAHDYDWWLRAEEVPGWKLARVEEPLCTYRVHSERITVRRRAENDALHWATEARKRRGLK